MKYGKQKLLLITNLVLIAGNVLAEIDIVALQLVGRFFWGLAAGVYTVLVPKFINETAPSEYRGPLGAMS